MIVHNEKGEPIAVDSFHVNFDVQNVNTETGFMIIDLSDTTNWKHDKTGQIVIHALNFNANPTTAYRGDITLGFLSDVTATSSTLNVLRTWHFDLAGTAMVSNVDYSFHNLHCSTDKIFSTSTTSDTTFQSDVNLTGPDGNTSYPSGNGDLVLKVTRTAGNVDVNLFVSYTTES